MRADAALNILPASYRRSGAGRCRHAFQTDARPPIFGGKQLDTAFFQSADKQHLRSAVQGVAMTLEVLDRAARYASNGRQLLLCPVEQPSRGPALLWMQIHRF